MSGFQIISHNFDYLEIKKFLVPCRIKQNNHLWINKLYISNVTNKFNTSILLLSIAWERTDCIVLSVFILWFPLNSYGKYLWKLWVRVRRVDQMTVHCMKPYHKWVSIWNMFQDESSSTVLWTYNDSIWNKYLWGTTIQISGWIEGKRDVKTYSREVIHY